MSEIRRPDGQKFVSASSLRSPLLRRHHVVVADDVTSTMSILSAEARFPPTYIPQPHQVIRSLPLSLTFACQVL